MYRSVDLAEDAEIVKLGLSIQQILLTEGLPGNHLNFSLHNVVAGVIETRDHHVVNEELFALLDCVSHIFAVRLPGEGLVVISRVALEKP